MLLYLRCCRFVALQSTLLQKWSCGRATGNLLTGGPWASSCMNFWWDVFRSSETHRKSFLARLSVVSSDECVLKIFVLSAGETQILLKDQKALPNALKLNHSKRIWYTLFLTQMRLSGQMEMMPFLWTRRTWSQDYWTKARWRDLEQVLFHSVVVVERNFYLGIVCP